MPNNINPFYCRVLSSIITSATWTVFLVITLRYCQNCIKVDRDYKYLHKLEDAISFLLDNGLLYTREGKAYRLDYPFFSKCVWIFYIVISPIIVALVHELAVFPYGAVE